MAPEELAAELGISGKHLRNWLRKTYPRSPSESYQRWSLDARQVERARAYFTSRRLRTSREHMTVTTVAIETRNYNRLGAIATKRHASLNELVRQALAEWLAGQSKGRSDRK